ncbi:uncharacterized protein LOC135372053 [Ornithodoros turicata]|uniref:uncharacterized protein LOC135372053 n=1 Tax=Ornithodoros turicata TaxID=34597 RepID=UPI0031396C45
MIAKEANIIDYTGTKEFAVPGMAFPGGICTDYNVGMGLDDAKYYLGIEPAVRLLAQLLGAPWDNDTLPGCQWKDSYIMGNYLNLTKNAYKFSECSKKGIRDTLRERLRTSMKRKANESLSESEIGEAGCFESPYSSMEAVSDKLPGQIINENEFCRYVMPKPQGSVQLCGGDFRSRQWTYNECLTRCCDVSGWIANLQIPYRSLDGFRCYRSTKVCYAGACVDAGTDVDSYW